MICKYNCLSEKITFDILPNTKSIAELFIEILKCPQDINSCNLTIEFAELCKLGGKEVGSQRLLDTRIIDGSPDLTKTGIKQLADDIGENSYLRLAVTLLALCMERAPNERTTRTETDGKPSKRQVTGLKRASKDLADILDFLAGHLAWADLLELKGYAKYSTLHRIVLGRYQIPYRNDEAAGYYLFLAVLLLYVWSRGLNEPSIRHKAAYDALSMFRVENRISELFPIEGAGGLPKPYEFPEPAGRITSMEDLLRDELHIENPADRSIAADFKVKASSSPPPTRYICYRLTTKLTTRRRTKTEITKSYLEIYPPRGEKTIYSFKHVYLDTSEITRVTDGFVIKLEHTFYFFGSSRRADGEAAVSIKVIAIPTSERGSWANRDFVSGLYMSNDSGLKPIVGRILLARARDIEYPVKEFCGRIPAKDLMKDIKYNAANSNAIRPVHQKDFPEAIRNKGQVGNVLSAITVFEKSD
jgi:hypothetical protein